MNDETVREIPILFSGQMVNAIRAGRKTLTRRVVDLRHVLTPDQKKIGFEQCNGNNILGSPNYLEALDSP